MRLAYQSGNRKVVARMSRSVLGYGYPTVPVCPTVPAKRSVHPLKDTIRPLGENALSEEILRWLFHCFLVNTVVFLPLVLRQRTHRNAIQLSRYSAEYSRLTERCQDGTILAWKRNRKHEQCALTNKILRPLQPFGGTLVSPQTMKPSALRCSERCEKLNSVPLHTCPKKGTPIHPRPKKSGAFWAVHCKRLC